MSVINNNNRSIAIYTRVASPFADDQSRGLKMQHQQIISCLNSNGINSTNSEIVVFEEVVVPYQKNQRPVLRDMLEQINAGKFDAVAFDDIDRLPRYYKYLLEIDQIFKKAGVSVFIVSLGRFLDMSRMEDQMFISNCAIMAQMFSSVSERGN
jgi:DNA invertase Pin-like site-specific DNA recombinase